MKLRQKLAMVLATAMVVTAVPVTTMAKSTNGFNKTITMVEGTTVTTGTNLVLNIDLDETAGSSLLDRTFFLVSEAFDFNADLYNNANFLTAANGFEGIESVSAKKGEIKVVLTQGAKNVAFPIHGTVGKGTPAIRVEGEDSVVSSGVYALGGETSSKSTLTASNGDATTISVEGNGTIADVKIEEKVQGALAGQTVTIDLGRRSDLEFANVTADKIKVEGSRGLAGEVEVTAVNFGEKDKNGKYDGNAQIINITFNDTSAAARGMVTIKGLEVEPENKREDVKTGEVKVTVSGEKLDKTTLTVATVADYDVAIKVKEAKTIKAGRDAAEYVIQLSEKADGSFDARKDVYFTIEGAEVQDLKKGDTVKVSTGELEYVGDNEFFYEFDADAIANNKADTVEFTVKLAATVGQEGDIVVKAESKGFEDGEVEAVIGEVEAIVGVKTEAAVLKVGLNGQKAGEIVISEVEAGTFDRNSEILITVKDAEKYGISLEDATIEVKGDIKLDKLEIVELEDKKGKTTGQAIKITVDRSSDDEAATITIKDLEFDVNRITPEGNFGIVLAGDALCENGGKIVVEDFIKIGTKNTEDIQDANQVKEVVLAIDSKEYTVDGKTKTGAAAPYIKDGRTMIPTRLVSEEFGALVDFGTINGVGTVTIQKEGTTIQFQNKSNVLNKNGIQIPMDAATVIKDGVTYVPFRYLATALNITNFSYDQATNTVTFKN